MARSCFNGAQFRFLERNLPFIPNLLQSASQSRTRSTYRHQNTVLLHYFGAFFESVTEVPNVWLCWVCLGEVPGGKVGPRTWTEFIWVFSYSVYLFDLLGYWLKPYTTSHAISIILINWWKLQEIGLYFLGCQLYGIFNGNLWQLQDNLSGQRGCRFRNS